MQLTNIGSNMTQLTLNDGTQVLFSYQTPVACYTNGQYIKTLKYWSKTTSRHINKWLDGVNATTLPQEFFDNLTRG